jgi:hypothetical protein
MRKLTVLATLILLMSPALAQAPASTGDPATAPPGAAAPPSTVGAAPPIGSPLHPGTTVGLDKVGDDGISTKTVKAVPCGTAARETDGTTTCIGIPDASEMRSRR